MTVTHHPGEPDRPSASHRPSKGMAPTMQAFHGPEDHAESPGQGDEDKEESRLDAVLDDMLAHQTPRQQALAAQIWDRFVAGDDVDDVRDLIADLSRTATEDAEKRREVPRTGGNQ